MPVTRPSQPGCDVDNIHVWSVFRPKEGSWFCLDPSSLVWPCVILVFCEIVSVQKNTRASCGCRASSWLPAAAQSADPGGLRKGNEGARAQSSFLPLEQWHSGGQSSVVEPCQRDARTTCEKAREEKEPVALSPWSHTLATSFFFFFFFVYLAGYFKISETASLTLVCKYW